MHKQMHTLNDSITNLCEFNQSAYDNFRFALEAEERHIADKVKESHQETFPLRVRCEQITCF
jgi:hypothetical protein